MMAKIPKALSSGEELFAMHLTAYKIPFSREHEFADGRKWRFDFIIIGEEHGHKLIAVEIEGGTWKVGRHTSGKGYAADLDKYNTASFLGWHVYRFTTEQVSSGAAIDFLRKCLNQA